MKFALFWRSTATGAALDQELVGGIISAGTTDVQRRLVQINESPQANQRRKAADDSAVTPRASSMFHTVPRLAGSQSAARRR